MVLSIGPNYAAGLWMSIACGYGWGVTDEAHQSRSFSCSSVQTQPAAAELIRKGVVGGGGDPEESYLAVGGDEGDGEGPVRGRQGNGGGHAGALRGRRPPPPGLRHRRSLRRRALPRRPHPHPREARLLPRRPQAPKPGCALPVHELGRGARQAGEPHLHPLHLPRASRPEAHRHPRPGRRCIPGPRAQGWPASEPHGARPRRGIRPGQQGQRLPRARVRRLPAQVHLRARGRAAHHRRAHLRHRQERLGVRRRQEVRRGRLRQGHLPGLHQAARARVEQELQRRRILQGGDDV